MGNKQVNPNRKGQDATKQEEIAIKPQIVIPPKTPELTDIDYAFLEHQTHQSREEIKEIFDKFARENKFLKLDCNEFVRLYTELRPEPAEQLNEISEYIFSTFDRDHNGTIDFNEFMITYALTSRGDVKKKLDYAFALYDSDKNGYLDMREVKGVLFAMLDLLGADKKNHDLTKLTNECVLELDKSRDGIITKDEFVNGLLKNYSMRSLMSPFN